MSDWEDNFGAGYSAENLISSINHSNRMEAIAADKAGIKSDELWFRSFDEAVAWCSANPQVQWRRQPDGTGYRVRILSRNK